MTMIMTGVAKTGGSVASLNRFARCSGWTRRVKEPFAPSGIGFIAMPSPVIAVRLRTERRLDLSYPDSARYRRGNVRRRQVGLRADAFWSPSKLNSGSRIRISVRPHKGTPRLTRAEISAVPEMNGRVSHLTPLGRFPRLVFRSQADDLSQVGMCRGDVLWGCAARVRGLLQPAVLALP